MKAFFSKSGSAFWCAVVLTILSVSAEAARPTKPPTQTPNPCEKMDQPGALFPSYVFTRRLSGNTLTWGIYLADSTGKCERLVKTFEGGNVGRTLELWMSGSTGLILDSRYYWIQAMTLSVTFDPKGIPIVTTTDFEELLQSSALPQPSLAPTDWLMHGIDIPYVSPDGTRVLMNAYGQPANGEFPGTVTWICNLNPTPGSVAISGCEEILFGQGPEYVSPAWGSAGQTVYFTHAALSGSGNAVYRMTWPQGPDQPSQIEQIWSRGTLFRDIKVTTTGNNELLAVSEVASNGCHTIYVVDAGSCGTSGCTNILNGAGHGARWGGWLPDGRIIAEGQSAPSKRNACTATNQVVTFQPEDLTGTVVVMGEGYQPDGAGSG